MMRDLSSSAIANTKQRC